MTGTPGGGCIDPRATHTHWCGFCGADVMFSREQCQQLMFVPPCPRCMETTWRDEADALLPPPRDRR